MTNQRGQILLITIMILATVLTVILAITFKSSTETKLTHLEEESQKALSAAQAGIEAALSQGDTNLTDLNVPQGFTGQATVSDIPSTVFVSPLLQQDQQYTFYLTNDAQLFSDFWLGDFDIFFDSQSGGTPTLELTLIKEDNSFARFILDPEDNISAGSKLATAPGSNLGGFSFAYKTANPFSINTNSKVLIIRTLFAQTRVGIKSANNLPLQGKYVTSEAKSPSGVTKKVQLFQSYPQIPAEFFVTSF